MVAVENVFEMDAYPIQEPGTTSSIFITIRCERELNEVGERYETRYIEYFHTDASKGST